MQAWSERATGDDEVNASSVDRVIGPFQIPMLSVLAIVVMAVGLSRVMLAVSKTGAVVFVAAAAVFIFGGAVLIAKSRAPRAIVSAIVTFGAVAVLAGGIVGAVAGEREFHEEEHGEDHSEEGGTTEGVDE